MSDHLLRLARIVANTLDSQVPTRTLVSQCEAIICDLEAAESQPKTRTITRAQLEQAAVYLRFGNDAEHIARLWGITVEDA
mgnify:CR=1 FL=1